MTPKKLTVSRKELVEALKLSQKSHLSPGFCQKQNIPLTYSCIVFTAHRPMEILDVCTSTLDMTVRVSIRMTEDEGLPETFTFAVTAQDFLPVFRRLEGEDIRFRIHEHRLEVLHSFGSFSVPLVEEGLDAFSESLARIQERYTPIHLKMEAASLRSVLNRCAFAMDHTIIRPTLCGISVRTGGDTVDFAASDGHKLVRIRQSAPGVPISRMIIPGDAVKILRHILPSEGSVNMFYSMAPEKREEENKAGCYVQSLTKDIDFWFKPVQGRYPDYTKVIPTFLSNIATIDRGMLLNSLDRLSFLGANGRSIISMNESCLHIKVSDEDFRTDAEERIPAVLQGPSLTFGMNLKFLMEVLRNIHTRNIQIAGNNPSQPFIIRPENQTETETITMLVMPFALGDEE